MLLTGATGFVGMELLARYLERTDRRVYALVRGADEREAAARDRADVALACSAPTTPTPSGWLRFAGDLTRPGLGLGRRRDALAERVSEIVHGAASVSFELGLRDCARDQRGGHPAGARVRRALPGARWPAALLLHLDGVRRRRARGAASARTTSTSASAFTTPTSSRSSRPSACVAGWRERLPITVLRPSIVVGERDSGWTASFNVLYWPLRAFARGAYVALPARATHRSTWCRSTTWPTRSSRSPRPPEAEGATFHLTAGRTRATSASSSSSRARSSSAPRRA